MAPDWSVLVAVNVM